MELINNIQLYTNDQLSKYEVDPLAEEIVNSPENQALKAAGKTYIAGLYRKKDEI